MFHEPEFYPNISLKLSRVLEEIGVNERMVLKRRRTWLLNETINNIMFRLEGNNVSSHYFGSLSEGTTTPGLLSDTDTLVCDNKFSVIQDWGDWEPGINLLMIQEETTPPGYCMLQRIYNNVPIAVTEVRDEHHVKYRGDKVLLKNTFMNKYNVSGEVRNGPAKTHQMEGFPSNGPAKTYQMEGFPDQDIVSAFPFKTLPKFLSTWLQKQIQQGKLSHDMKRYIESNPCYVVGVGKKNSSFEETEWRISTSHAERCLMFGLNSTQLQCYFMLKLLLKTYLKHPQEKALSSFMCKNILLLCKGQFHPSKWCSQNLLSVFTFILLQLKRSILQEQFPHFIIHENNLMAQKFTPDVKKWLLGKVQFIYETHGYAFLGVQIDDIGIRLQTQLNPPSLCNVVRDIPCDESGYISGSLLFNVAKKVSYSHRELLHFILSGKKCLNLIKTTLVQLNHHGGNLEKAASRLLTPLICSSQGSMLASRDIYQNHSLSPEALTWLSMGLNSDAASSRLKLASVYYCVSDFYRTEIILRSIEQEYDPSLIQAVCDCYCHPGNQLSAKFNDYAIKQNEQAIQHIVAFCVSFIPDEVHCQPQELQYEMYRSTHEDRVHRNETFDYWMDWAVVDSLPYLYFLQYKTYGHLQRYDKKQRALNNLYRSIHSTGNLYHKETALNLLGQCYKQENRHRAALHCYVTSLTVRPTNNAAKLHICRLLYAIYRNLPSSDMQAPRGLTSL